VKQKKQGGQPIPYDYEAAFPDEVERDSIDDILEADRKNRGDVYATKEIRSGEQLEVEIYPEFGRGQRHLIPPEARRKTKRAQKNLNEKNSRKQCERVINENFGDRDIWATFTYAEENVPASMDEAQRNMQNFIRRVNRRRKKQGLPNARYVYVTECSPSGRWHHHIVIDGDMDMDTLEELWQLGRRNQVRRLSKDENGLSGMAHYLTKESKQKKDAPKGLKSWKASKGLKKPQERVNHYKFKRKDIREMAKDAGAVQLLMEKWYGPEGYVFTSARVRYNDFNGRFYIYARLRRQISERKEKKKGRGTPCKSGAG
jgi:hypothetical protein